MHLDFWHSKWEKQEIGFHQNTVNENLLNHWHLIEGPEFRRIFLPLCGKSIDLVWLANRGHKVTGVEISQMAIEQLAFENFLTLKKENSDTFSIEEMNLTLIKKDIFSNNIGDVLGSFDTIYDRAALVAILPEKRKEYVNLQASLLAPKGNILLVSLDYETQTPLGPPFNVSDDEIKSLYQAHGFKVDCLRRQRFDNTAPRFKDAGVNDIIEQVYLIQK